MECIEARALKSSFLSQTADSQVFQNDDVWCFNTVASDDFLVEDLLNLDFPDKDGFVFYDNDHEKSSDNTNSNYSSSDFSAADKFDTISAGELTVPVEERENLEWLSQFVDDSTSELSLMHPAGSFSAKTGTNRIEPVIRTVQTTVSPCFPLSVPVKARSKRSRSHGRAWSLDSLPLSFSSAESSSTSLSSNGSSIFVFTDWFSSVEKPPVKKLKRKEECETGLVSGRRCTHCLVQKTPQWRTGPLGPKTLCNACGVRFKSGRLFPEYRPACSPTFSQEMHSNSHRKVLEMRRKKEVGPGLVRAVQSF